MWTWVQRGIWLSVVLVAVLVLLLRTEVLRPRAGFATPSELQAFATQTELGTYEQSVGAARRAAPSATEWTPTRLAQLIADSTSTLLSRTESRVNQTLVENTLASTESLDQALATIRDAQVLRPESEVDVSRMQALRACLLVNNKRLFFRDSRNRMHQFDWSRLSDGTTLATSSGRIEGAVWHICITTEQSLALQSDQDPSILYSLSESTTTRSTVGDPLSYANVVGLLIDQNRGVPAKWPAVVKAIWKGLVYWEGLAWNRGGDD